MEIGKPIKFKVSNLAFDSVWNSVLNSVSRPTRNIRHGNR